MIGNGQPKRLHAVGRYPGPALSAGHDSGRRSNGSTLERSSTPSPLQVRGRTRGSGPSTTRPLDSDTTPIEYACIENNWACYAARIKLFIRADEIE